MTIEEAVSRTVSILLAGSPVQAVSLDILPEEPIYPAVCVRLIDEETLYALDGTVKLGRALIQIDVFTREASGNDPYADATELAEQIHGRPGTVGFSGFRGTVDDGGSPSTPFVFSGVFREDRRRQYDPDAVRIVTVQQDYRCWYKPN